VRPPFRCGLNAIPNAKAIVGEISNGRRLSRLRRAQDASGKIVVMA
jgi:hypothetical protein